MSSKRGVGRRRFLRSAGLGAGAALLTPLASRLAPVRAAEDGPRKRFVVFVSGNGWPIRFWDTSVRSERDYDMPSMLEPLSPFRDELLLLERFHNPHNPNIHTSGWATLSVQGSPATGSSPDQTFYDIPSGISLDRFLSGYLSDDTPFSSTNLALKERGDGPHVSADDYNREYPSEWHPVRAYESLFGAAMDESDETARRLLAQQRSVLDFMDDDVTRMQSRLGVEESRKMEQYLDSLRGLELQLGRLADGLPSCGDAPIPPADSGDRQRDWGPVYPDVVRAQVDLSLHAQLCGLTRVSMVSFFGGAMGYNKFDFLGAGGVGHHDLHHANDDAVLREILRFEAEEVAHFWSRLKATPEADGSTMADHTVLLWINSGGGDHHFGRGRIPAVVLGHADGFLNTGRYVRFPSDEHCVSDLFVTIANALGVGIDSFGDPALCRGPLETLIA